jgi:hypothetical protein
MIQSGKFLGRPTAYTEGENTVVSFSLPGISPELLWGIIQGNFAQVAWRKAVHEKNQVSTHEKDALANKAVYPAYNKSKFTGSPAFKELKNLILIILTSQKGNS